MKPKFRKKLVYITILVFSIVIIPLSTSGYVSIPMLALMYCSPFLYLKFLRKLKRLDWLCLLLMLSIGLTAVTHPEAFRASTVLYSCMFVAMFMTFARFLNRSGLTVYRFNKLCRTVIIAYAVVIVFQQIGLITGTYIINGSYNMGMGGALKVNGFTAEASSTAAVIIAMAWGYIKSYEMMQKTPVKPTFRDFWKRDKKLVIAFLYVMFGTGSVTCVMSAFFLFLYFIPGKYIIRGVFACAVLFTGFLFSDLEVAVRIRSLLPVLLELDARAIYLADASSSARIGPYILYIQEFDITKFNTWFGYGCDYGGLHVYSTMADAEVENNMGVGGIINSFYDYGFIMFLAFMALILHLIKLRSFEMFLFISIYFVKPFNMHVLWIYPIVIVTINYLKHKYSKQKCLICKNPQKVYIHNENICNSSNI